MTIEPARSYFEVLELAICVRLNVCIVFSYRIRNAPIIFLSIYNCPSISFLILVLPQSLTTYETISAFPEGELLEAR